LPDPRQAGKVIYPLDEVLLLCLLAVLAGAESFVDIARFGETKIDLLRQFRSFRDGKWPFTSPPPRFGTKLPKIPRFNQLRKRHKSTSKTNCVHCGLLR
jgi:hypothetical protein